MSTPDSRYLARPSRHGGLVTIFGADWSVTFTHHDDPVDGDVLLMEIGHESFGVVVERPELFAALAAYSPRTVAALVTVLELLGIPQDTSPVLDVFGREVQR